MKKKLPKQIFQNESTTVEWKQALAEIDEIIETAAGFANTEGGRIFIGGSPVGKVLGVQVGKGTIEKLVNQIAQHTDPKLHPNVSVKRIDSKEIIVVEVKESHDHLVLAFGKPYKRVGRSTVKMTKDEYERLILDKHAEEVGSGTSKIVQWCKEWGLPEPTYEEAGGSFVTVFHNPKKGR